MKYLVIYEKTTDGYSAYVPDLPGCTTAGRNKEETEVNIAQAIKLYLEELEIDGKTAPEATTEAEVLSI